MSDASRIDAPALSAVEQLRRYVVVVTVFGLVLFIGSLLLPSMFALGVPALIGGGVVTVLLGRSVGWIALLAPLIPVVIWSITFALLIAFGTDGDTDERGLASLFAFLAILLVVVGGEVCALAGILWGIASPVRPRTPGPAAGPGPGPGPGTAG